jgi:hypothetical protein
MAAITDREKRTIQIAAIAVTVYLALFYGVRGLKELEAQRGRYRELVEESRDLKQNIGTYENKILLLTELKNSTALDPAKLDSQGLVGEASAAIQQAAQSLRIKIGPIRESSGRAANDELATMHLEGSGQIDSFMKFLRQLNTLGFPLIVDSVRITRNERKPGQVEVALDLVILDFEQWKSKEQEQNA